MQVSCGWRHSQSPPSATLATALKIGPRGTKVANRTLRHITLLLAKACGSCEIVGEDFGLKVSGSAGILKDSELAQVRLQAGRDLYIGAIVAHCPYIATNYHIF